MCVQNAHKPLFILPQVGSGELFTRISVTYISRTTCAIWHGNVPQLGCIYYVSVLSARAKFKLIYFYGYHLTRNGVDLSKSQVVKRQFIENVTVAEKSSASVWLSNSSYKIMNIVLKPNDESSILFKYILFYLTVKTTWSIILWHKYFLDNGNRGNINKFFRQTA